MSTLQHYVGQLLSHYDQLSEEPEIEEVGLRQLSLRDGTETYVIRATRDPEPIRTAFDRLRQLRARGFTQYVPILPTRKGEPTVPWGRSHCYLRPLYPEADLGRDEVVLQLAETLARLHCDSEEPPRGGVLLHGGLHPETVRISADGCILLDHWTDARRAANGAADLATLIELLGDRSPQLITRVLRRYMSTLDSPPAETAALLSDLQSAVRGPVTGSPRADDPDPDGEGKQDSLLARAHTAVARGKWTCGEEDVMNKERDPDHLREQAGETDEAKPERDPDTCREVSCPAENGRAEEEAAAVSSGRAEFESESEPSREEEIEEGPLHWRFPPPLPEAQRDQTDTEEPSRDEDEPQSEDGNEADSETTH